MLNMKRTFFALLLLSFMITFYGCGEEWWDKPVYYKITISPPLTGSNSIDFKDENYHDSTGLSSIETGVFQVNAYGTTSYSISIHVGPTDCHDITVKGYSYGTEVYEAVYNMGPSCPDGRYLTDLVDPY